MVLLPGEWFAEAAVRYGNNSVEAPQDNYRVQLPDPCVKWGGRDSARLSRAQAGLGKPGRTDMRPGVDGRGGAGLPRLRHSGRGLYSGRNSMCSRPTSVRWNKA